jgi:hypothetical protein
MDAGTDGGTGQLKITTENLPDGTVGVVYMATLAATNGKAPYTWTLGSGALPQGVSLSMAGVLSGTPAAAGTFNVTINVGDSSTPALAGNASFTITIKPAEGMKLMVTTTMLDNAIVGAPYSATLAASGGMMPYSWGMSSGALPTGLSLGNDGTISGTPTATPGNYSFTVKVTDMSTPTQTATAGLSITVMMTSGSLTVTNNSLPGGTVGLTYTATLTAAGGTVPYMWTVSQGALPAGLTVSTAGVISGTPTAPGTATFTAQVTDSSTPQQMGTKQLMITIAAPTLTITTASLPDGLVSIAYTATVAATGGVPPYMFTVSQGTLPAGLTLNASTGAISGTPTTAGTSSVTVTVSDSQTPAATAQHSYNILILPSTGMVVVTTTSLPDGVRGQTYTAALTAAGGFTPYMWSITQGSLPPGLTQTVGGTIQGTATSTGTFTFTAQVADAMGFMSTANLTIRIFAPIQVTTTALPSGVTGTAYTAMINATGGDAPLSFLVSSGSLPPGLTLAAGGGISGTPTQAGNFGFGVTVADVANPAQSVIANLSITITAPLQITTTMLANGTVGAPYSVTLVAQGGTPSYAWSISAGALPAGIALNATSGVLSGVPSAAGAFNFTVRVTDMSTPMESATAMLSITVIAPAMLTITTPSLADGVTGRAYSATLNAVGGISPYTWSISAGALPPGLSLNATTGVVSGMPTNPGSFMFTVEVTDAATPQNTATQMYTIRVANALTITTAMLPTGFTGSMYSAALNAQGGTTPDTWSIINGALPPGLGLNAQSGVISGTPSNDGTFSFTVRVVDSSNPQQSAQATLTLRVLLGLTITTASLPNGTISAAYMATVVASGGTQPYTFAVSMGMLPPGVALDMAGNLTGTPTMTGRFTFTVRVTDTSTPQQSATQQYTVAINGQGTLTITTPSTPNGVQGRAYSAPLNATGGTTPYFWFVSGNNLPPGLALNTSTGLISGTPTSPGTFGFEVTVNDQSTPTQTSRRVYFITIFATLQVTTVSLPGGVNGQAYSASLAATGGDSPYAWSISSGALPTGLTLDPTSGTISGTPTMTGTFSFTVTVRDTFVPPQSASANLSIAITNQLQTVPQNMPTGITMRAYSATLQATGGTTPYAWTVQSGGLPPGLSLASNGAISGTPTTVGSFSFTAQVTDASTPTQSATLTVTIVVTTPLGIANASLPRGTQGLPYSAQLDATGGIGPFTWSIVEGTFPPGLTLNPDGSITGTPTTLGTFAFVPQVVDNSNPNQIARANLSITISPMGSLSITTATLPDGIIGRGYSTQVVATGGQIPYVFTITSGSLPPGLSMNASGAISGIPTTIGSFSITVQVNDNSSPQQTASRSYGFAISGPIQITTTGLPGGVVGAMYSATLTATGGILPYTWSIEPGFGTLPPGLALDPASGTISGAPTMTGVFSFVVRVTDSGHPQQTLTQRLQITVSQLLVITTMTLSDATVNSSYNATLQAMGGTTPYAWQIVSGQFPPGLVLDSASGAISGTPTTLGTFTFTARVTDSGSPQQQASQMLSINVTNGP